LLGNVSLLGDTITMTQVVQQINLVATVEPSPCTVGRGDVELADGADQKKLEAVSTSCNAFPRLLWTVSLIVAMFAIGIALAMLGPTLGDLKDHFEIDLTTAGALFTFRAVGNALGALSCGIILEKTQNRAIVFFVPLLGACAGAFVIPHITSFVGAGVMFAFQGMAMGMLDTGGNVIMLALWRGSKFLNGLLHGFHFVFGFGALVGPAVVNAFRCAGFEGSTAWMGTGVCLMPCCIGFGVLCFLPHPDMIKEEEGAASPWTRAVVLSAVFLFMYVGNEVTYGGFITIFLEMHLGINSEAATTMASLYWGMLSLGRLVATAVTSHINHTKYLVAHLVAGIVAVSVLGGVSTNPALVTMNGLGWWAGVVVPTAAVGFAFAPLFPGAMLVTEELLGGAMSGRAASLIVTAAACGEAFFPIVTGTAIPPHPNWFSWIMLASCCAMLAIFILNAANLIFAKGASDTRD